MGNPPPGRSDRENRDPLADAIEQAALTANLAFNDALSDDLRYRLGKAYQVGASTSELLRVAQETLQDHAADFGLILADATVAGWLAGAGKVTGLLPAAAAPPLPPPIPPLAGYSPSWEWDGMKAWLPLISGAVLDLQGRELVLKADYEQLSDYARAQAFTVADLATVEAIGTVRQAVADAVDRGDGFRDFLSNVEESLGESALSVGRWENVFRTNVATAYSDGMDRILAHPLVEDEFPYEERLPIRDNRLTVLCDVLSRSGIQGTAIYRRDDPARIHFAIPTHWNCRCSRRPMSIEDAAARGIKEAQKWLETGIPPERPAWVPWPQVDLPPGWRSAA